MAIHIPDNTNQTIPRKYQFSPIGKSIFFVAQNNSKPQQILIFFMLTFFREQCTSFPL
jgi:hypothetical protein